MILDSLLIDDSPKCVLVPVEFFSSSDLFLVNSKRLDFCNDLTCNSIPHYQPITYFRMFKPISGLLRITTRSSSTSTRFQSRLPSITTISSRPFLTSLPQFEPSSPHPALPSPPPSLTNSTTTDPNAPIRTPIGQIQRRLQITFTCTATLDAEVVEGQEEVADLAEGVGETTCGHRSTHEFSKRSYDHGIVLIECPGCKNRHLIGQSLLPLFSLSLKVALTQFKHNSR